MIQRQLPGESARHLLGFVILGHGIEYGPEPFQFAASLEQLQRLRNQAVQRAGEGAEGGIEGHKAADGDAPGGELLHDVPVQQHGEQRFDHRSQRLLDGDQPVHPDGLGLLFGKGAHIGQ